MVSLNPNIEEHNSQLRSLQPIDPETVPFTSLPEPTSVDAFCRLHLIRTGTLHTFPRSMFLLDGPQDAIIQVPVYSFLIEHASSTSGGAAGPRRLLYELGVRNPDDHEDPRYRQLDQVWTVKTIPSVAQLVESKGFKLETIEAMILGHAHFDHIGDLRTLPPSVDLVVGPGSHVGKELAEEMDVPLSTIEERTVKALDRENDFERTIGTLPGYDYFGDGSLWLLDTPGHKEGHIAALVRTQTSPPLYYILGSDTTHHRSLLHNDFKSPARCGLFPMSNVAPGVPDGYLTSMHIDLEQAYKSIAKLSRLDRESNVVCLLAHDISLENALPSGDFVTLEGNAAELARFKARKD